MVVAMWHEIKGGNSFGICVLTYKCLVYMIDVFIISSPDLLVFGDDHVRGTHEQMMLQADLVRHRAGAGLGWDKEFSQSFIVYDLEQFCKHFAILMI